MVLKVELVGALEALALAHDLVLRDQEVLPQAHEVAGVRCPCAVVLEHLVVQRLKVVVLERLGQRRHEPDQLADLRFPRPAVEHARLLKREHPTDAISAEKKTRPTREKTPSAPKNTASAENDTGRGCAWTLPLAECVMPPAKRTSISVRRTSMRPVCRHGRVTSIAALRVRSWRLVSRNVCWTAGVHAATPSSPKPLSAAGGGGADGSAPTTSDSG